jgi:hypothetical protein
MRNAIVDTNLLCLFIVGSIERRQIGLHKRLRAFSEADFDHLLRILSLFPAIMTTPHILTETSNLLRHSPEPLRSLIGEAMARFIGQASEIYSPSVTLVNRSHYHQLGITDCAILVASEENAVIISDDLDLCLAAMAREVGVINYNYFRDGAVSLSDIQNLYS